jgi:hypothetical protein
MIHVCMYGSVVLSPLRVIYPHITVHRIPFARLHDTVVGCKMSESIYLPRDDFRVDLTLTAGEVRTTPTTIPMHNSHRLSNRGNKEA